MEKAIPVSLVDRLIGEVEKRIAAYRRDVNRIQGEIAKFESQKAVLVALKTAASAEGGIVRDGFGMTLTDTILSTIGNMPDMTSGDVAGYLAKNSDWPERNESKDFVKTVQTMIGQLVQRGRIERDSAGRLTLPASAVGA